MVVKNQIAAPQLSGCSNCKRVEQIACKVVSEHSIGDWNHQGHLIPKHHEVQHSFHASLVVNEKVVISGHVSTPVEVATRLADASELACLQQVRSNSLLTLLNNTPTQNEELNHEK